jgi:hypothetical protein
MKTIVIVEIVHDKPISDLADRIAGRAWTLDGVRYATAHVDEKTVADLEQAGFSLAEISLGVQEVVR